MKRKRKSRAKDFCIRTFLVLFTRIAVKSLDINLQPDNVVLLTIHKCRRRETRLRLCDIRLLDKQTKQNRAAPLYRWPTRLCFDTALCTHNECNVTMFCIFVISNNIQSPGTYPRVQIWDMFVLCKWEEGAECFSFVVDWSLSGYLQNVEHHKLCMRCQDHVVASRRSWRGAGDTRPSLRPPHSATILLLPSTHLPRMLQL